MTVVVTGATGHIGANLVRALLAEERRVRALVRRQDNPALAGLEVELCQGDVLDPESLDRAFRGASVVYHLAGRISLLGDRDPALRAINVDGTRHVAQAARRSGARRLVHFSSCQAFDLEGSGLLDESAPRPTQDHPAYDRSKAEAERQVRAEISLGLDAVIVNPSGVVGPHDYRPSRLGKVLLDIRQRRLPALIEGSFDAVDVRDVVSGAIAAERRGRCGDNYLLTGTPVSVVHFARLAGEICGSPPPRIVCPAWLATLTAPMASAISRLFQHEPLYTPASIRTLRQPSTLSASKAHRELGFESRPLADTLRDTFAFFDHITG